MNMLRCPEQGSGKIAVIVVLVIAALGGYAAFQIMPLSWEHARFEQLAKDAMIGAVVPPYKDIDKKIHESISASLNEMKAQYQPEHIKVDVSPDFKHIQVEVWYARSHGLPFYQNPKQFYSKLEYTPILPKTIDIVPQRPTAPPLD